MSYWETLGFILSIKFLIVYFLYKTKESKPIDWKNKIEKDKFISNLVYRLILMSILPFVFNYTIEKGIKLHGHISQQLNKESE